MNLTVLIDAIVRQTTVLIAELATSRGLRAPLSHIADEVFLELSRELERQGLSRKVTADMFGLALRTYQRKVQRLQESASDRGRTLWDAVYEYIRGREVASRADIVKRFRGDDEMLVRGVLNDLVESGLVFATGPTQSTTFRAATDSELGAMERPESTSDDLSDPRSATTPDCVEAPCTGELRGVYRVTPPAGVQWRPGEPLLSTTPGCSVVLLLEETSDSGPRRVGVGSLAADLSEQFWSWREAFEPPGTNLRGSSLFPKTEGIVLVEYRAVEAGGNLARITALDEGGNVSLERTANLPEGIFLMDVSASGAVTMIRAHNIVGVEGPAHPDCPSENALLVNEPDNALSVLRCPVGVNFGRFESSPSGYMLGGGVHGDPPGTIQADLGDGAVRSARSCATAAQRGAFRWRRAALVWP